MLNLAAIKYRNVLASFGGPIVRICSTPVSIFGRNTFQANAFLAPGLVPKRQPFEMYGNADGTGSSESPQIARYMAVSEALERWAFHIEHDGPNAERYGFRVDRSSNGMAAFPGLLKRQAQEKARYEALERFALISWWDCRIDADPVGNLPPVTGIHALRLRHTADFGEVVVLYREARSGHVSYGHAAAKTVAGAIAKAMVELARNEFVITYHKLRGGTDAVNHYFERRCLHFAGPEGHEEFRARLGTPATKPKPKWQPVFDGEIVGPWSQYATVWRTAVQMPTQDFLDRRLNFFFW